MRKLQEIILEGTFRYSDDKYEAITLFSPININKSCTKTIRQSTALSHRMHHLPKQERRIPRGCLHTQQNPIPGRRRRLSCIFLRQKVIFNRSPKSCRAARGQTGVRSRSDGGEEEPAVTQHRALIPTRETQPRSGLLQEGAELRHRQSYWQGNTLGALLPCGEKNMPNTQTLSLPSLPAFAA